MFLFAGLGLVWSIVTFGAVLPYSSLLLVLVWVATATLFAAWRIVTLGRLDYLLISAVACSGFSVLFGPHLALWALAALWAWKGARDNPRHTVRYMQFLVIVGILEACLGLVQYFIAPGWMLGYQNTSGNVMSGTFINKNHFAGLIEMLIPCCLGLSLIPVRHYRDISRSYLYVLAGAFMGLALAFSLSRMGIFSFLLTVMFLSILLLLRKTERPMALGLGLGLVGLLTAGVLWIGIDVIVQRYAALMGANALVEEGRGIVFHDTIRMIRAFPQGVGVGNYQDMFRRFQTVHLQLLFDHAHNDYLETAAEWGIGPAVVFWVVVGTVFVSLVLRFLQGERGRQQGILLASIGAIFAILVHSLADFNLQIPSNAILFFSFIGIGLGTLFPKNDAHWDSRADDLTSKCRSIR